MFDVVEIKDDRHTPWKRTTAYMHSRKPMRQNETVVSSSEAPKLRSKKAASQ
jgi:hypothetical protein